MAKVFAIIQHSVFAVMAWLQVARVWLLMHLSAGVIKWISSISRRLHRAPTPVKLGLLLTLVLALTLGSVSISQHVFAAGTFQVSGTVTDGSSQPISGGTVAALDPSTNQAIASTTTNSTGNYSLTVASGTYNIQVTPPTGSGLAPAVALGWSITTDTMLNFVLIPAGSPVTVSGRVLDNAHNPLSGIRVQLSDPTGQAPSTRATTDSTGAYSIQTTSGTYQMSVTQTTDSTDWLYGTDSTSCPLSLTQSTTLSDIIIPFQNVTVHTQDPSGNPISGVRIGAGSSALDPITIGPCPTGSSSFFSATASQTSDTSGNVSMQLVPGTYNFTATPPSDSGYSSITPTGVVISTNQAEVFVIEPIPPSVNPVSAPSAPAQINSAITTSATFTDVVPTSTHTAIWDWGDGTTSSGMIQEANGSGTVTGSHSYAGAGVYTATVNVTSNRGGVATAQSPYIVIYDPTAGFVTGGGWINSPSGAYVPNATLIGKATFGFVAKYAKGAAVPSGQTEFQFQVANLTFHSTSYQWLVVAGAKAQYKGTGTINGSGNYTFLLTAVDGSLSGGGGIDKFRIKIWDTASGTPVYDNQMGAADTSDPTTALGGGQIIIHS